MDITFGGTSKGKNAGDIFASEAFDPGAVSQFLARLCATCSEAKRLSTGLTRSGGISGGSVFSGIVDITPA